MTAEVASVAMEQHRLIHDLFVLIDDGDQRALELYQLSPLEFAVLQQLDTVRGQRLTDVGAKLLCVKSTITRVVDRLERDGLVVRTPDPDDRRAQRLLLTTRGACVRTEAMHNHQLSIERRMNLLSSEEHNQLNGLLKKLCLRLREDLTQQSSTEEEHA